MKSNAFGSSGRFVPALPPWTIAAPLLATAILVGAGFGWVYYVILIAIGVAISVFAAVHHAEVIAHRVGEPVGTLVLALAVTLIEVALIVSLMIAGGSAAAALARDTVFAAVMIILNGIVGLSMLVGGMAHREQAFSLDGVSAALVALAAITVLTLIFPNFTVTTPGPFYSPSQLVLIAVVSVVIYGSFVFTQTVGHRPYFLDGEPPAKGTGTAHTAAAAQGRQRLLRKLRPPPRLQLPPRRRPPPRLRRPSRTPRATPPRRRAACCY